MPMDFFVLLFQAGSPDASTSNRSTHSVHTPNTIYKPCGMGKGALRGRDVSLPVNGIVTAPVFTVTGNIS